MTIAELKKDGKPVSFTLVNGYDECSTHQLVRVWNFQQRENPGMFEYFLLMLDMLVADTAKDMQKERQRFIAAFEEVPDEHKLTAANDLVAFLQKPLRLTKSRARWFFGWKGPRAKLKGYTFERLAFADTVMRAYLKTKNPKMLNALMGVIYTPLGLPWANRFMLPDFYAWCWRVAPIYIKVRLMLNFKGLFEDFTHDYPYVYHKPSGSKVKPSKFGYEATFINLAHTKFGSKKQLMRSSARDVMIYLDEQARAFEESKPKD